MNRRSFLGVAAAAAGAAAAAPLLAGCGTGQRPDRHHEYVQS